RRRHQPAQSDRPRPLGRDAPPHCRTHQGGRGVAAGRRGVHRRRARRENHADVLGQLRQADLCARAVEGVRPPRPAHRLAGRPAGVRGGGVGAARLHDPRALGGVRPPRRHRARPRHARADPRAHAAHPHRQLSGARGMAQALRRHVRLAGAAGGRDLLREVPPGRERPGDRRKDPRRAQRVALPRRALRPARLPALRLRQRAVRAAGGARRDGAGAEARARRLIVRVVPVDAFRDRVPFAELGDLAAGRLAGRESADEITRALEAGKPITQARVELDRSIFVFRDAAEEATRIGGEVLPTDALPVGAGRLAITRRFPLSPIVGITPFNFPVLLAAHKIAPAMACGAATPLTPPPQDPLTTLRLAEIIGASGYPVGGVNVVPCHVEVAQILIEDPRVRMISFTGSAKAGWAIRAKAGTKRVALELGGNAAVLVEPDADLAWAASRCAFGGFTYAGQSCISTQRIFVHERVMQPFLDLFLPAVRTLHVGDVLDDATEVGPLISLEAAERVERWIGEAVQGGAEVATGGTRRGQFVAPTVL